MALVSVVIPAYNRLELLAEAVKSVQAQTFQDFEIIIVDDGSRPPINLGRGSKERIIRHEKNRGAAAARNTGIQCARGDFIAFLDSDDLWLPEKLADQITLMKKYPEYGACVTGFRYETEEGLSLELPEKPNSWLRELSKGCAVAPGTTLMVRRICYPTVGLYDEALPRHEDFEWLLRFAQSFDMGVVQKPLAIIRRAGPPPAWKVEVANQIIIERYRAVFLRQGKFFGRQVIGKRWLETSIHAFSEGDRAKGLLYLKKAIRENPIQRPTMYFRVLDLILGTSIYLFLKRLWLKIRW